MNPEKLPYLARVAFGARCARRVQTLLDQFAPTIAPEFLETIDRAITLAERSSAEGRPSAGLAEAVGEAERRARGALGVSPIQHSGNGRVPVPVAAPVVRAVAYAAAAAACAALEPSGPGATQAVAYAGDAVRAAGAADIGAAMASDFQKLEEAASRLGWNDQTRVSPAFFERLGTQPAGPKR
jgi:hypothetical protein